MPESATNPRIGELSARLKADPKSRLFYPLAEELRKIGRFEEAESVLREGLAVHSNYISAWVSLGRVLKETNQLEEATDVLARALSLDPGNVVAARLAGDAFDALGEKVEAIKKYKLVQALMPGDQEIEAKVEALDREINRPTIASVEEAPAVAEEAPEDDRSDGEREGAAAVSEPEVAGQRPSEEALPEEPAEIAAGESEQSPFDESDAAGTAIDVDEDETVPGIAVDEVFESEEHRWEPAAESREAPVEEPFGEEPFPEPDAIPTPPGGEPEQGTSSAPFDVAAGERGPTPVFGPDEPAGALPSEALRVDAVGPFESDITAAHGAGVDDAHPFEEAGHEELRPEPFAPRGQVGAAGRREPTETIILGDLYARQGHYRAAREIYAKILAREPGNVAASEKLRALPPDEPETSSVERQAIVRRLERWLSKMGQRRGSGV